MNHAVIAYSRTPQTMGVGLQDRGALSRPTSRNQIQKAHGRGAYQSPRRCSVADRSRSHAEIFFCAPEISEAHRTATRRASENLESIQRPSLHRRADTRAIGAFVFCCVSAPGGRVKSLEILRSGPRARHAHNSAGFQKLFFTPEETQAMRSRRSDKEKRREIHLGGVGKQVIDGN
jgi:hypothetical protein